MGISDKYWLVTQIPPQTETLTSNLFYDPKNDFYQVDFLSANQPVPAGGALTRKQHLFAGAKVLNQLAKYRDNLYGGNPDRSWLKSFFGFETEDLPRFDRAVDFGYFFFLTKPFFVILDRLYRLVGNFGIAIMCLTVLVKVAMFPLANKSYRSMSKMKILGPKMQELKEKYRRRPRQAQSGDDGDLQAREGQPARRAACRSWCRSRCSTRSTRSSTSPSRCGTRRSSAGSSDLSAPDPTSVLNLFGLIPWDYHVLFTIPLLGRWSTSSRSASGR